MKTRALQKLSDAAAKSDKLKAGRHSDGGGLYLNVSATGSKSWLFMWTKNGKRREMGLGPYPAVSLSKARIKASEYRALVADGVDPLVSKAEESEPTFAECASKFLASMEGQWRNEKHRAQWRMTLNEYAKPLHAKRVSETSTDDVLKVLSPIWLKMPETAARLRGRIERVLDYAKARGWRSGENPALWRGHLKNILPARQKLTRGHHAAMPYPDVPTFVEELPGKDAMAARGLEFLVLTAARSGEVLGAKWSEMDLAAAVWTIPANRMKGGKEHRVPLSPRALAIVKALSDTRVSDFVFPGQKANKPLSGMAFEMLMRRMKVDAFTVHGFRSAFRDWAGDETSFPREIAEQALAHRVGDATERAYRRADALDKRRKLMDAWSDYCLSVNNVIKIARA